MSVYKKLILNTFWPLEAIMGIKIIGTQWD